MKSPAPACPGPSQRRDFLRLAFGGFGSLSLSDLFRLRAAAAPAGRRERTALIVIWLQGGASHLETYDPKPQAPSEIRGPYAAIASNVPGIRVGELLPHHARVADKFTLLRSLVHTGFCHQQGNQQVLTGHPVLELKLKPDHPDICSVTHLVRAGLPRVMPAYLALNPIPYVGAAYLGRAHEAFDVPGDPNLPGFQVPNIRLDTRTEAGRLNGRMRLRDQVDDLGRRADRESRRSDFDTFQDQAWNMVTRPEVARAFDISQEDPRLRDRYGRNTWGQRCLLARRLVEAGVELVTTSLHGPLCGRVGNWDDHAVNHHIFEALKFRCQFFDRAVAALIDDLHQRGLNRRVLVMVTGEFGRTPRISYQPDSSSGVTQPGRDHWPRATALLFSGGGSAGGQVIGATDSQGADVTDRRVGVRDILATLYTHLGIDAERVMLSDRIGRPVPALPEGRVIPELVAPASVPD
jgi:uncharacterized protein (DUF1501 family)